MSEQQNQPNTNAVQETPMSACPHPEAGGKRWGDLISEDRQEELKGVLGPWDTHDAEHDNRKGPFDNLKLSGADVFWLAKQAFACLEGASEDVDVRLRAEDFSERLSLDFSKLHLEGASLVGAHLEGGNLRDAHLEGADLSGAHLEGAYLPGAHLEGAYLLGTHMEGANLAGAHIEGKRHLPDDTNRPNVQKVIINLQQTLPAADLREAFFDSATMLRGATLCAPAVHDCDPGAGPQVVDIRWGSANLAILDWTPFTKQGVLLGDERRARDWRPEPFEELGDHKKVSWRKRIEARRTHATEQRRAGFRVWADAVRANRQLATVLRNQGLNEDADRFAYKAQKLQRQVLRRQRRYSASFGSWLLDIVAGYGYKPMRTLAVYLLALISFASAYFVLGQTVGPHLSPLGAFVFSMTSFHGRGFFPGGIVLDDPITVLAAFEAFVGLVVEVSFIATFTQRFFAR